MKKIFCELHMFDAEQQIFIVDSETNQMDYVATTSMDELPEIISATCYNKSLCDVMLAGNSVFCQAVAEDVLSYSLKNYNKDNIKVEVLKK